MQRQAILFSNTAQTKVNAICPITALALPKNPLYFLLIYSKLKMAEISLKFYEIEQENVDWHQERKINPYQMGETTIFYFYRSYL